MIYTHGFFSGMTTSSALISTAFLKKGGYNVLALDTKNFIYLRYIIGTTNLRFIGEALGNFLVQLNEGI